MRNGSVKIQNEFCQIEKGETKRATNIQSVISLRLKTYGKSDNGDVQLHLCI